MSFNFLSFGVNDIWVPKASSDSSWPSSPSSSREKTFNSKKMPVSLSFNILQPSSYSNMPPSQSTSLSISVTLPSPSMSSPNPSPNWPSSTIAVSTPSDTSISRPLTKSLKLVDNPEKAGKKIDNNLNDSSNPRFKTKICRSIKERGICLYGNLCKFAHNWDEMKDKVNNNKYKTALCQKYWINGCCVYGPTCSFVHYENMRNTEAKRSLSAETPSYLSPIESFEDNEILVAKPNVIIYKDVYDSGNSSVESCGKFQTSFPHLQENSTVKMKLLTPFFGPGQGE